MDALDKNNIIMLTPPLETETWEVSIGFFISWVNKDEHSLVLPDCALGMEPVTFLLSSCRENEPETISRGNLVSPANQYYFSEDTFKDSPKGDFFFFSPFKMWSYLAQFQLSPAGFSAHTWFPSSSLLQSTCHLDFSQCCLQRVAIAEPSSHGWVCQGRFSAEGPRSKPHLALKVCSPREEGNLMVSCWVAQVWSRFPGESGHISPSVFNPRSKGSTYDSWEYFS